ncbi:MAG: zinc carboxypeptidase [Saprospiraceae bacterium]|nr:zinc carboxypeptidase [Saprospiraceae bacterium]
MKNIIYRLIFMVTLINYFVLEGGAQKLSNNYFLPEISYSENIPDPQSYFGFQIGEWHVNHDQLTAYLKLLAEKSDRIEYVEYARSHENRPLFVLMISSPSNLKSKEKIKLAHHQLADGKTPTEFKLKDLPAILYQGYTIHGNEPSGNNAALLVAYYLAAGQSKEVTETIDNIFILFDPCLNPDGTQRFATWVNSHKGKTLVTDPASREFNEIWPGGRYNHYWFDMNRDWLLLTQPESRGRIKLFQDWRPNVLTDHHEMGTNSTFFFQPGIPSGTNPNTPKLNQDLTEDIGKFHAAALDSIGSRYYTKASFDDFYYGKGSTYPDAQGCIGILFEQASSRGHLQESVNGLLSFPFTIRNQIVTSLSTHRAILKMKNILLEYKKEFPKLAMEIVSKSPYKSYVYTDEDQEKLRQFTNLLLEHQIEVYGVEKDIQINGKNYQKNKSYIVPLAQKQPILASTMFESVTEFQDSSFYDVSGWTVAAAYNLQYSGHSDASVQIKNKISYLQPVQGKIINDNKNVFAWAIETDQMNAHKVLYRLQQAGIKTLSILENSSLISFGKMRSFIPGTIIIPSSNQIFEAEEIRSLLEKSANELLLNIYALDTGNGTNDISLGHPKVVNLEKPLAAMIVGQGISPQSAGEIWHHADIHLDMPITMIENSRFRSINLNRYNTLILPDATNYSFNEQEVTKIKDWIRGGNTLILIGRSVSWAVSNKIIQLSEKKLKDINSKNETAGFYQDYETENRAKVLGGTIVKAGIDRSHPLFYGYHRDELSFLRSGTKFYETTQNRYASPAVYKSDYLVSGYIPKKLESIISGSSSVTVHSSGSGKIIGFQDNPLFRGYWIGGHLMFNNALFLGKNIVVGTTESQP